MDDGTRTLDRHIQRLRKKLGWQEHIKKMCIRDRSIAKQTYIVLEPYVIAAIMDFIIVFPLSKIIAAVERRMSKSGTR